MTHLRLTIPFLLAASGALAAEPVPPGQGVLPDAGHSLRLLTPRDPSPIEMPPLTDSYRCEPVLRIDEGTPIAFVPQGAVSGRESRNLSRLCEN